MSAADFEVVETGTHESMQVAFAEMAELQTKIRHLEAENKVLRFAVETNDKQVTKLMKAFVDIGQDWKEEIDAAA